MATDRLEKDVGPGSAVAYVDRLRPTAFESMKVGHDNLVMAAEWCAGQPWPTGRPRCVRLRERTTGNLCINAHPGDTLIRLPDGTHRVLDTALAALVLDTLAVDRHPEGAPE
jgi:hypothetical protein